jgi:hypothetical protein
VLLAEAAPPQKPRGHSSAIAASTPRWAWEAVDEWGVESASAAVGDEATSQHYGGWRRPAGEGPLPTFEAHAAAERASGRRGAAAAAAVLPPERQLLAASTGRREFFSSDGHPHGRQRWHGPPLLWEHAHRRAAS